MKSDPANFRSEGSENKLFMSCIHECDPMPTDAFTDVVRFCAPAKWWESETYQQQPSVLLETLF